MGNWGKIEFFILSGLEESFGEGKELGILGEVFWGRGFDFNFLVSYGVNFLGLVRWVCGYSLVY